MSQEPPNRSICAGSVLSAGILRPPALSYDEALAYWFGRINYEQTLPEPADLKLDRMRSLLRALGNPQERLRIIHVAGSKGKGSTAAMLSAILRQAGYRTGLFTSPHLCRVEERMQVDGQSITAEELSALIQEVREAESHLDNGNHITYFEVATAVGFLHFVRRRVEVAVVEVGLGGRFDSTNVCRPLVSLITSISFDHTRQLGHRLASIAMEKAGIVKPGRPTISGATPLEARTVIEHICRERSSPLRQLGTDFHYSYEPGRVGYLENETPGASQVVKREGESIGNGRPRDLRRGEKPRVQIRTRDRNWPILELGLLGEHQAANAAVAVACVEHLKGLGWHIDDRAVADGLAQVEWPARLEVVKRRPLVVLDCAHNVASAEALVQALLTSFPPARRVLIFAVSNDKDVAGMFRILAPHFALALLTRYQNSPRSMPPEQLAELLRRHGTLPSRTCPTAEEAWRQALRGAGPEDLICITGSVFLAGELRPLLVESREQTA